MSNLCVADCSLITLLATGVILYLGPKKSLNDFLFSETKGLKAGPSWTCPEPVILFNTIKIPASLHIWFFLPSAMQSMPKIKMRTINAKSAGVAKTIFQLWSIICCHLFGTTQCISIHSTFRLNLQVI